MSDTTTEKKQTSKRVLVSRKYAKRSQIGELWHRMKRNRGAVAGLVIVILLLLILLYSLIFIDRADVTAMDAYNRSARSSWQHPFGTDDRGRDLFIRVIYGTRYSLMIGIVSVGVTLIIGLVFGAVAGYFGGAVDEIIMRISDVLASIPAILMGMVIVVVLGQGLRNLIIAITVTGIPSFIRITRASILTVKNDEFVESARAIGMSNSGIIFTEVVPNCLSPIIVTVTTRIGIAILESAVLSYLGFGIPIPEPEWGALISAGRNVIRTAPHLSYFPGIFIMITVLAFNILGDGLRDALDPKLKR